MEFSSRMLRSHVPGRDIADGGGNPNRTEPSNCRFVEYSSGRTKVPTGGSAGSLLGTPSMASTALVIVRRGDRRLICFRSAEGPQNHRFHSGGARIVETVQLFVA